MSVVDEYANQCGYSEDNPQAKEQVTQGGYFMGSVGFVGRFSGQDLF